MLVQSFLAVFSLAAFCVAENDVGKHDIPSVCWPICQFTTDLSSRCEESSDGDDEYRSCVCGASNARAQMNECASCVQQYDDDDSDDDDDDDDDDSDDSDDENDVSDLMDDCGWDYNYVPVTATQVTTTTAVGSGSSSSMVITTSFVEATGTPTPTAGQAVTQTPDVPASAVRGSPKGILIAGGAIAALLVL